MKSRIKCAMCNKTLYSAYSRKGDSSKYCRLCLKKTFNGVYVFTYTRKKDGGTWGFAKKVEELEE